MSEETLSVDVLVIGAGVIGLAVAANLPENYSVILVDKFPQFGRETSSRNSEVIHSGIYYPPESKKTSWCLAGRRKLYQYCEENQIPFQKCGKFVVATSREEEAYLEKLASHCHLLGLEHRQVERRIIEKFEPLVKAYSGVFLPETGVIDSHLYMASLERKFLEKQGMLGYRHEVQRIEKMSSGWEIVLETPSGELKVTAASVVNCAGLAAAEISNQALGVMMYEHRYCRGRYFLLSAKYQNRFEHLIYPVPQKDGLGVHVTRDISGFARLGPDTHWCLDVNYASSEKLYDCNWEELLPAFLDSARRYCPQLTETDLSPGLIGIRPKLFVDGVASPDFLVENLNGFIHCLGIESPGLTASPAIADEVVRLVKEAL